MTVGELLSMKSYLIAVILVNSNAILCNLLSICDALQHYISGNVDLKSLFKMSCKKIDVVSVSYLDEKSPGNTWDL